MTEANATPAPPTNWQFAPGQPTEPAGPKVAPVSWTASEYMAHQKSAGWYALLVIGSFVASGLIYLLTRDFISAGIVIILAAAFGVIAARQPKVLHYQVGSQGIQIENKSYPYSSFKSFSVINEGAVNSISLTPLKRFMPDIGMYYAPDDEEKILNTLANYLPLENRTRDPLDRLMHKIRF